MRLPGWRVFLPSVAVILLTPVSLSAQVLDTMRQTGAIACSEPGSASSLADVPCRILVRQAVERFPPGPLMWMLDTFPTLAAAQALAGPTAVAVVADGRAWLLTVGRRHAAAPGAGRIGEVGPLPLPAARRYQIVLAFAKVPPGAHSASHTHSGPEAWFVLAGAQCVETAQGVHRTTAGHGTVVPADVPMYLTATGQEERRAFFLVVHDAERPWDTPVAWKPPGSCARGLESTLKCNVHRDSGSSVGAHRT